MPLPELAMEAPALLVFLALDAAIAFPVVMLTVAQITQIGAHAPHACAALLAPAGLSARRCGAQGSAQQWRAAAAR